MMEAEIEGVVVVTVLVEAAARWGCCDSTSDGILDEIDTMAGSCQSEIGCIHGTATSSSSSSSSSLRRPIGLGHHPRLEVGQ